MSKISEASRTAILNDLIQNEKDFDEIALDHHCSVDFVSDTKETLDYLIKEGILIPFETLDWPRFRKATAPLERLVRELAQQGASLDQIKTLTKLSRFQIKHILEVLATEGEIPRSTLGRKPSLEARLLASIFAVNYLPFKRKPFSVNDVVIARKIALNEAKLLENWAFLTLSDVINVAQDLRGGQDAKYTLTNCPKCQHPFLRVPGAASCPFCEWAASLSSGEK